MSACGPFWRYTLPGLEYGNICHALRASPEVVPSEEYLYARSQHDVAKTFANFSKQRLSTPSISQVGGERVRRRQVEAVGRAMKENELIRELFRRAKPDMCRECTHNPTALA